MNIKTNGTLDPYLGAPGYFDGSDVSIIIQADGPKLLDSEKREIETIYGSIFSPSEKPENSFESTLKFLRSRDMEI